MLMEGTCSKCVTVSRYGTGAHASATMSAPCRKLHLAVPYPKVPALYSHLPAHNQAHNNDLMVVTSATGGSCGRWQRAQPALSGEVRWQRRGVGGYHRIKSQRAWRLKGAEVLMEGGAVSQWRTVRQEPLEHWCTSCCIASRVHSNDSWDTVASHSPVTELFVALFKSNPNGAWQSAASS